MIIIKVKKGETLYNIANKLKNSGCISSINFFVLYLRFLNLDRKVKPGKHKLICNWSYTKILDELVKENIEYKKITIPEGYSLIEVGLLFEKMGICSYKYFMDLARIENFKGYNFLGKKIGTLEGFLFPDTYYIDKNNKNMAETFIHMALNNFFNRTEGLSLDYDKLIMASIIEKEAKAEVERAKIAGVFYNRLKKGMPLESCATIQYIFFNKNHKYKRRLYYKDLELDSKFNTYKYKGLPPAPICNPGIFSIRAAINPDKHKYLYFVSIGDRHHFSKTLHEHNKWKKKLKSGVNKKNK